MLRKVFRTGNSVVVSIPKKDLEYLEISEGSEVNVLLDAVKKQIIIKPAHKEYPSGVDEKFSRQVREFINRYRPALEELAE